MRLNLFVPQIHRRDCKHSSPSNSHLRSLALPVSDAHRPVDRPAVSTSRVTPRLQSSSCSLFFVLWRGWNDSPVQGLKKINEDGLALFAGQAIVLMREFSESFADTDKLLDLWA